MKEHRQAYEMLPSGTSGGRREPRARIALLLALLLIVAGGAGWAAVTVMNTRGGSAAAVSPPGSPAPAPTVAPTPDRADDTAAPPRTIAAGADTIPENLALPHENDPQWAGANLKLPICTSKQPEQQNMAQARDLRTVRWTSDVEERTETLVIAADESAAAAIYDDFVAAMSACPGPTVTGEATPAPTTATVRPLPVDTAQRRRAWDASTVQVLSYSDDAGVIPASTSYVLLARSGKAVVIAANHGEAVPPPKRGTPDAGVVDRLQAVADEMGPQLCPFRADRCLPPWFGADGQPTFPPDTIQLPDGNLVFPDGTVVAPDGQVSTPNPDTAAAPEQTQPPIPAQPGLPPP